MRSGTKGTVLQRAKTAKFPIKILGDLGGTWRSWRALPLRMTKQRAAEGSMTGI
jgi:hypothetical protein